MASSWQRGQHPVVDYHNRTPQSPPPQDGQSNWGTGANLPAQRPAYGDGLEPYDGSPAGGALRPRYSERDYADHGYWEDQQPARRFPTPVVGARLAAAADQDKWRASEALALTSTPSAPVLGSFDDDRDYSVVLWWTGIWYAAAILLYALLAVLISTSSMRSHALHALIADSLGALFAFAISLGVAAGIRRISLAWRAISTGFSAFVLGVGIVTLAVAAF
jgi:hypothetical protein